MFFSHIYVEREAAEYATARAILPRFSQSVPISISHYKDVFCRRGQNFTRQKRRPQLILAVKREDYFHRGSRMCDGFGQDNFIYTTQIMNCPFDCAYCYLRGLYGSANVVIFVNPEDTLQAVANSLPAFICVSYDTDLLAFEALTGYVRRWLAFCAARPEAVVEIRTKSAAFHSIAGFDALPNVQLAWTVSPDSVIERFERGTPGLNARLADMRRALEKGWRVRLCVDPIIKTRGWEQDYRAAAQTIRAALPMERLLGVSVGCFRVSKTHYARMEKLEPFSEIFGYTMEERDGTIGYPDEAEMIAMTRAWLTGGAL
ncbi:MAG: radical SAM protein [Clostridiales bacterium]|jgi:spore photoproduct lyase|nr:radical SAM protein [Clostridiales bacterium]